MNQCDRRFSMLADHFVGTAIVAVLFVLIAVCSLLIDPETALEAQIESLAHVPGYNRAQR